MLCQTFNHASELMPTMTDLTNQG